MIPPSKHLEYATGFLHLGLLEEARAEIAQLSPEAQEATVARQLRIEIAMISEVWLEVVALAPGLIAHDSTEERPWIAWAYALRELQRIEEARDALLTGARLIRDPSPLITYNLACYACLLGDLPEARRLLDSISAQDSSWRDLAGDDPDLAALFPASP